MSIWTPEEARKFAINCIMGASSYEQSDAEEIVNSIAAMKRREAGEVVGVICVVTDEDSQYGISAHFSYSDNIAGLAPGDYECYTFPPSQPSTGVPDGWLLTFESLLEDYAGARAETAVWNATQRVQPDGGIRMPRPRLKKLMDHVETICAAPRSP